MTGDPRLSNTHRLLTLIGAGIFGLLSLVGCGGGGGSSGGGSGGGPNATVPRFAYVANFFDDTISMYAVDAESGQFRARGYIVAEDGPRTVTVAPGNRFAYVANIGSDTVSAYTIDAATGMLTAAGSSVGAGMQPFSVAVDPSTRFAYVANFVSGTVSAYTIDATTGALTRIDADPVTGGIQDIAAGSLPSSVTIDPSGRFVYVANGGAGPGGVSAYTINANTGALTEIAGSPFDVVAAGPSGVTVHPGGRYAYVACAQGFVSAFTINATTGALAPITGTSFVADSGAFAVSVDPSGRFAYVANTSSNNISAYTIDAATGALTAIANSPFAAGSAPVSIAIDPSGKFAYTANQGSDNVQTFAIDSTTGALAPLANSASTIARSGPTSVAIAAGTAAVTYTPKFAYVANQNSNDISAYTINTTTGALTRILCGGSAGCNGNDFLAGSAPGSVSVDPSGKFAYVANQLSADVSAYTINATTGALTRILCGGGAGCNGDDFQAGGVAVSFSVDPSGKFAYVANQNAADVSAYTINASTGALTRILCGGGAGCNGNDFLSGTNPSSVTVDPSGKFAYVANSFNGVGGNSVSAYTINATTGALTQILCGGGAGCNGNDFLAGTFPTSVSVDPSGKFAYVANFLSNDVSAYTINATTGALTRILCGGGAGCNGNDFLAGSIPASVSVDPSGKFAYVANQISQDVSAYTINATTGALARILCGGGAGCNGNDFRAGTGPTSVAVDPSGKFAYVANFTTNDVSAYTINATTGALTSVGAAMAAGTGPSSATTTGTIQ